MAAPTLTVNRKAGKRRAVITVTADIGSAVTVYRDAGYTRSTVRGADSVVTESSQTLFTDYEVPQNIELSYTAVAVKNGVTLSSDRITISAFDFGGDVMYDLGRPWAGTNVTVESFPELSYQISRDVINVWDRSDPVVVSGMRQYPSGTLNLITLTLGQRSALLDILNSGNLIAFSAWKPTYGLDPVMYFSVGEVRESRPSPIATEQARKFAIEVQLVKQPPGSFIYPTGGATWSQVKAPSLPWSNQLANSWLDVAGL